MDIKKEYERWLANATADADVVAELKTLDDAKIEDAFYRDLAFGTGGLRGVIGAGTNRMNIYTVAKASQGLADYLKENFETPSVVIGYDSRIKSDVFAKVAAGVFAAKGVKVNIWPVLMPVPTVSFATRYLHTSAGVMVTASHNPSKYNGYKVYGADGCQITTEAAAEILAEIEKLDIFADVKTSDFEAGVASGSIQYIPDEVYTAFVEQVKSQSVLFGETVNKDVAIVYSPLNGTGLKPVTRTLKEMGYTNITVVKEQEQPDGKFPTCPYPNPEIKEAMALGMEYAKKCNADLLLATDPDCDRVGIAVKNKAGEYELLTGNQIGSLLAWYRCMSMSGLGIINDSNRSRAVMVKTFVTTGLQDAIGHHFGYEVVNVLTGFKYIAQKLGKYEEAIPAEKREGYRKMSEEQTRALRLEYSRYFVFGGEESYGYLAQDFVRDKDANSAAIIFAELAAYAESVGKSLLELLHELFEQFGVYLEMGKSLVMEGADGAAKIAALSASYSANPPTELDGVAVSGIRDFSKGDMVDAEGDPIPAEKMIFVDMADGRSFAVRPSGTEPKIKYYLFGHGKPGAPVKEALPAVQASLDSLWAAVEKDALARSNG